MLHQPRSWIENSELTPSESPSSAMSSRDHVREYAKTSRWKLKTILPDGILENIPGIDELAQEKRKVLEIDVAKIQSKLSSAKRNRTLDRLARERLNILQAPGTPFEHDEAWLQARNLGENIHRGAFSSGSDIMKAFIDSQAHRANIKGSYSRFGVAIEGDTVVILYENGAPRERTSKQEVLEEMNQVLEKTPEASSSISLFEILCADLTKKGAASGITVIKLKEPQGIRLKREKKAALYLFQENTNTFVRKENGKLKKIKSAEVIADAEETFAHESLTLVG